MRKLFFITASHVGTLLVGFALGIYALPILTAPKSPDGAALAQMAGSSVFQSTLQEDLRGNDFLHWGKGTISLSQTHIVHQGELAPGPDYKLYLVKDFVEHEDDFLAIKDDAYLVGDVKTFDGFALSVPPDLDLTQYTTVLVWCEAFSEFITAGQYR